MTNAYLAPVPRFQAFASNSTFLVGGQLFTYAAGTNTPIVTYQDPAASIPNSNPIILNSLGECTVFLVPNVGYKLVLEDSAGNVQWTQDNVYGPILTTLFGGVDTGSVNAYQLSFSAPYSTLTNGIIIYWIPAHTNTGNSTLSITVNGTNLGVQSILNQNGTQLGAGQIASSGVTAVFYYNGNWLLTSSTGSIQQTGSFVGTLTSGVNTAPMACQYAITGNIAAVYLGYGNVAISGGVLSMTGLPTVLEPFTQTATAIVPIAGNNGVVITNCLAVISPGSSTVQFCVGAASYPNSGWVSTAEIGKHIGIFNLAQSIIYGLF
jgi:hypothetical protein